MPIQLACDYGEAVTDEELAREWELTQYVSAINIACGGHAGDEESMLASVASALSQGGIKIGAHPSYVDPRISAGGRWTCRSISCNGT